MVAGSLAGFHLGQNQDARGMKMHFDALYYTDNENDNGYRVIEATSLQDAKLVLKAQMAAEGIPYRLDALVETAASFVARTAA